jgi:TFIIF-interacting CTD phosphatase-like protein
MFQSDNAIPITSWFDDKSDRQVLLYVHANAHFAHKQLYDLLPFLDTLAEIDDVVSVLKRKNFDFLTNPSTASAQTP